MHYPNSLLCSLYILLNGIAVTVPRQHSSKPSTDFGTPPIMSTRKLLSTPAYTSSTSSDKVYVIPNSKLSTKSKNQSTQFGKAASSSFHPGQSFVGASSTSFTKKEIIQKSLHNNQSVTVRQSHIVFSTSRPSSSLASQFIQSSVDKSRLSLSHNMYVNSSTNVQVLPTVFPSPSSTHLVTSLVIHKQITSSFAHAGKNITFSSFAPMRKNTTSSSFATTGKSTTSSSFPPVKKTTTFSTSQPAPFLTTQAMRSSVRKLGPSSSHHINSSTKPFGSSLTVSYTNNLMTSFSMHQSTSSPTGPTSQSTSMSTPQLTNRSTTLAQSKLSATSVLKTTMTSPLTNSSIYAAKSQPSVASSVHTSPTKDVNVHGKKSKNQTSLIVGVTVGITVALILCITIVVCYRRKRASYQYNVFYDEQNIVMNPFDGPK